MDHFRRDDLTQMDDVRHFRQRRSLWSQQITTIRHLIDPYAENGKRWNEMSSNKWEEMRYAKMQIFLKIEDRLQGCRVQNIEALKR